MTLHSALNDFKRVRGSDRRFAGERRSTEGLFSGLDDRLVFVSPEGAISDYSYPLSGLVGIDRSRFGIDVGESVHWFDGGTQRYVDGTAVVETTHHVGEYAISQYDLTLGRLHLTHFVLETEFEEADRKRDAPSEGTAKTEVDTDVDAADITLQACLGFAPDGQAGRVGQLWHDDAVEVHHDSERDVLTASTGLEVTGQVPETFDELLESEPTRLPRASDDGRYEDGRLSPIAMAEIEFEGSTPRATVATLLTDADERTRCEALECVRAGAADYTTRESLFEAGRTQVRRLGLGRDSLTNADVAGTFEDLRALQLLRAPSGSRIAGPEFDPYYQYSGGYGYTWFRDDAEISRFLLAADRRAGLGLEDWHEESTQFYIETQRSDGTWPHRVWPHSGRLAPGWANGRLEDDSEPAAEYQADQTASVATYLATYLRVVDPSDERVRDSLLAAMDGLDASLEDDGLPTRVQNAWENMTGRFTHTAATFLEAYAAIARAPLEESVRETAAERSRGVYGALEDLWVPERGIYALRLDGETVDDRLDGSTFALASAHNEYDRLERDGDVDGGSGRAGVDNERLDRLFSHFETTIEGLWRNPDGPVEGIARFEDDPWRIRDQDEPKIWTVTTAWGAHAGVELEELLAANGHDAAGEFGERAEELLAAVEPGGSLRFDGGYLPEQVFDDGTPDCATPLGWPHALGLATRTALEDLEGSTVGTKASLRE
ncbi:glucan 1,4-alpha-glucosidase [Halostagnicola bangensis]